VARSIDVDVKHLAYIIERAARHTGTAFVEIYQDCNVFNHFAFDYASDKDLRHENILYLEHGKPMVFGKNRDKGLRLTGGSVGLEVVELGNGISEDDLLWHDEKAKHPTLAYLLSRLTREHGFPEPMGVLREVDAPRYDDLAVEQIEQAIAQKGPGKLEELYSEGETWIVN
jgi:2-oxoglutarate ferredoxin oxidoreductase subunit beta